MRRDKDSAGWAEMGSLWRQHLLDVSFRGSKSGERERERERDSGGGGGGGGVDIKRGGGHEDRHPGRETERVY